MFDRSYHFIPANKPKLFDRTASLGADIYVFDLEDAVSRDEKRTALTALEEWVGQQKSLNKIFIRVNGCGDPLAESERKLLEKYPELGIVLPKVTSAAALSQSIEHYRLDSSRRVIGLIEDAAGLRALPHILELRILQAVGLGLEDFLSHSIFETSQLGTLVAHIRAEIALTAMAWGIDAIDTISTDLTGGEQLRVEVNNSRSAGFNGKFSLHPSQIGPINEGFCPDAGVLRKSAMFSENRLYANLEFGYSRIEGETISPPKLKKLKIIKQFGDYHGFTNE